MALLVNITKNLLNSENPFLWKPRDDLEYIPDNMIARLTQKLEEKFKIDSFQFESIILQIALCYEYCIDQKYTESIQTLQKIESALQSKNLLDLSIQRYIPVFLHIVLSTKTHVLMYTNDLKAAFESSCRISSILTMTQNQAAVWGIKAIFYSNYGIYGSKFGIQFAVKANELNSEESLWYFLKGKLLGRVRRVEKPFDIPSRAELDALEIAFEKEIHPAYSVFLAEAYRETAYRTFSKHSKEQKLFPCLKLEIDRMYEASVKFYEKSLELKPDCPHMLFRCAKGFMKLPIPYKNDQLTKHFLKRGLEIAPDNPYGHHTMALFYERREKDFHLAMKHLSIASNYKVYGACMDMLRIQIRQNQLKTEEIIVALNKLYEEFPEMSRRSQTLSQFVSFYIFVEPNLCKAFEYIMQIIRLNTNCDNTFCDDISKHRSLFVQFFNPFSLIELLIDEIKIKLLNQKCIMNEREKYEKILNDLNELDVSVPRNLPQYLKNRIIEESRPGKSSNSGLTKRYWRSKEIPKTTMNWRSNPINVAASQRNSINKLQTENETVQKLDIFANDWKKNLLEKERCYVTKNTSKISSADEKKCTNIKDRELESDSESDGDQSLRLTVYENAVRIKMEQDVEAKAEVLRTVYNKDESSPHTNAKYRNNDKFENNCLTNFEPDYSRKKMESTHSAVDDDLDFEKLVLTYRKKKKQGAYLTGSKSEKNTVLPRSNKHCSVHYESDDSDKSRNFCKDTESKSGQKSCDDHKVSQIHRNMKSEKNKDKFSVLQSKNTHIEKKEKNYLQKKK